MSIKIHGNTGRVFTAEHRKKLGLAKLGKPVARKNYKHSIETRKKMGLSQKKRLSDSTKHPLWLKDRTHLAKFKNGNEYRNSPAHRDWSRQVKNRDGWKCKIANGDCSGRVESHHILSWKDYPELRYIINNGITLCHKHHPRKREDEMILSPYFQELVKAN